MYELSEEKSALSECTCNHRYNLIYELSEEKSALSLSEHAITDII